VWKQRREFVLWKQQVHCTTTKGNCSAWEACHKHNGLSSKGYNELIFILILFASLFKQVPGLFLTSSVHSKKAFICKHHLRGRAHQEPPLPLYCFLIIHNVKTWLPIQPACGLPGPADGKHMCAQHLHFIALMRTVNKRRTFPPLSLPWYKLPLFSCCFISIPVISRWYWF